MPAEQPIACPQCKSPVETLETNTGFYAYCSNDDCCGGRPVTDCKPTLDEAIAAWNRGETK